MQGNIGLSRWRSRAHGAGKRRRRAVGAVVGVVVGAASGPALLAAGPAHTTKPAPYRAPLDDKAWQAGATHIAVGQPGDVVVTGRWTCGAATPALLRPATGEVFRFDEWARPGHDVSAVAVATVPGASAVRAREAPAAGCDDLEVLRRDGPPVRLRTTVAG